MTTQTTHKKLSELMEEGAKHLAPYHGEYFDVSSEPYAACALGCAMFVVKATLLADVSSTIGYDIYDIDVAYDVLPDDLKPYFDGSDMRLKDVITTANDNISRERAIEVTKLLGY